MEGLKSVGGLCRCQDRSQNVELAEFLTFAGWDGVVPILMLEAPGLLKSPLKRGHGDGVQAPSDSLGDFGCCASWTLQSGWARRKSFFT